MVTPATPVKETILTDPQKMDERKAFFQKLMVSKKPMLLKEQTDPTPLDISKEESIAKYINNEIVKIDED